MYADTSLGDVQVSTILAKSAARNCKRKKVLMKAVELFFGAHHIDTMTTFIFVIDLHSIVNYKCRSCGVVRSIVVTLGLEHNYVYAEPASGASNFVANFQLRIPHQYIM